MASGFVGSSYNNNSGEISTGSTSSTGGVSGVTSMGDAESSVDFGGSVGYLWHNVFGAEFQANFTPNFNLQNSLAASTSTPQVNTYMFNVVGAAPFGADARWQPYISGGFGAVTLSGDTSNSSGIEEAFNVDDNRGGGNIGFGLMAFLGGWGVKGDVRYFRAFTDDNNVSTVTNVNGSTTTTIDSSLPGLTFWRANIGLAFRW